MNLITSNLALNVIRKKCLLNPMQNHILNNIFDKNRCSYDLKSPAPLSWIIICARSLLSVSDFLFNSSILLFIFHVAIETWQKFLDTHPASLNSWMWKTNLNHEINARCFCKPINWEPPYMIMFLHQRSWTEMRVTVILLLSNTAHNQFADDEISC